MKLLAITITFILACLALNANAAKITSDELNLGKPGSSSDKVINFGDTRFIRSNETTGKLEFSNDGGTIVKEIGSGSGAGGEGGINLLSNSSFEDGSPPQDWTNTGGTLTQESFANPSAGDSSFARFVATGAGQYVESALVTVPDDFSFGMMADVRYSSGSAFDLVILDSTGSVTYSSSSFSEISDWDKKPTDTFQTPAAGSQLKMRIVSTGAGTIDLNKAYLGSNKNIAPFGAGSTFLGSIQWGVIGNCQWQTNSTSFVDFPSDSDCDDQPRTVVGKAVDSSAGTLPQIQFSHLKKGHYKVVYTGQAGDSATGTDTLASFRLSIDGDLFSNSSSAIADPFSGDTASVKVPNLIFSFDLTESRSNSTLKLQGRSSNASESALFGSSSTHDAKIAVYYFPNQGTQEAFTPEQADFRVEAFINPQAINVNGTTSGTYLPIEHGSLSMQNIRGSAKIPCSGGNPSTGLTCSAGNEQLGITFHAPVAGIYRFCARGAAYGSAGSSPVGGYSTLKTALSGNDDVFANALEQGRSTAYVGARQDVHPNTIQAYFNTQNCDDYSIPSAGEYTFRVHERTNCIYGNCAVGYVNSEGTQLTVDLMSNNVARPVIQNMVDTKLSQGLRVETCKINKISGTPLIDSNECNSWIDFMNSNGLGKTDIAIKSGVFKNEPVCQCTAGINQRVCMHDNNLLNTSTLIKFSYTTVGGVLEDDRFYITCIGEK